MKKKKKIRKRRSKNKKERKRSKREKKEAKKKEEDEDKRGKCRRQGHIKKENDKKTTVQSIGKYTILTAVNGGQEHSLHEVTFQKEKYPGKIITYDGKLQLSI